MAKALYLRQQLGAGYYPVVHIPGHYVVVIAYEPTAGLGLARTDDYSVLDDLEYTPGPETVRPGDIEPPTDDEITRAKAGQAAPAAPLGEDPGYDSAFRINDPYITSDGLGGSNIHFYENIKEAPFGSIDQIVVYQPQ